MLLNKKFINRKNELNILNQRYKNNNFEFIPIYGRRRVGKTALIKEFIKDKNNFYFLAKKEPIEIEVRRFKEKYSKEKNIYLNDCDTFEDLFEQIVKINKNNDKKIIVFDEFPYLIEEKKTIVSNFQYIVDEILKETNIFLILCGSLQSIMESQILNEKSPLYGRRTAQLKVDALSFKHFSDFFQNTDIKTLVKYYSVLDGIPYYLNEFNPKYDFFKNIKNTFLEKSNILYQEGKFLLQEELREVNNYLNIMYALSIGKTKLNEISQISGVDITNINKYLKILLELKLIKRITPFGEKITGKKYIYSIKDNYYKFWIKYVYPYQDYLEIGDKEIVVQKIKEDIESYFGYIFEDISKQYLQEVLKLNSIAPWFNKQEEIDLVGYDINKNVYFCECKYTNRKIGFDIYEKLVKKSKLVQVFSKKNKYVLFSKAGFDKKLLEFNKTNKNLILIDLNMIEKYIKN